MRKIIHVDMDAFYVSVEIRDNPELADKPVAVGGSRGARGVLSTCNYIARAYGVSSAMPTALALKKCPHLVLLPARMQVYRSVSSEIRKIFQCYTDLIEPLSLDEAYLDVTDCKMFAGSATLIAKDICRRIFQELKLTASAGVSSLKFLAKIASDLNKPNGIYVIAPDQIDNFIDTMALKKIPGVGKVTNEKLIKDNFRLGQDIKNSSQAYLISRYGKLGALLWQRCHGVDERTVVTNRVRKSVGVERTFAQDIDQLSTLMEVLQHILLPELKRRAQQHLQHKGIARIGVKVKFSDFQQTTKDYAIAELNIKILQQLLSIAVARGQGKSVRLLGLHLGLTTAQNNAEQVAFAW
ncbi:DNA polymerase IV [Colwellia chukchiensis]|uniref:DNA polymerase IV n=1 Tax=Colwellia chukchiensis TaxID=641665 RepID=UPI0018E935ED|nr:DNA polymerase IV [Colwellia chukchiensis]